MDHLLGLVRAIEYNSTRYDKGMQMFARAETDPWPYAASSTGSYRGLLAQKYPCWEAHGPAREAFLTEIAGKIKNCLEQCLPESDSFIGYSLFMVGKSPNKTKPYIMMVSDDKPRRKAAFKLIKSQKFMANHPGFELGHCSLAAEFEDMQQLGEKSNDIRDSVSDSSLTVADRRDLSSLIPCATEPFSWAQPTKIGFHTPTGQHRGSGTCGGLFTYNHKSYCFTVAHALRHKTVSEPMDDTSGYVSVSSDSDDCEMTGMEDWDDSEEEDCDVMASASLQPRFRYSDNDHGLFEDGVIGSDQVVDDLWFVDNTKLNSEMREETFEQIGSIVGIEHDLDLVVIRILTDMTEPVQSYEELLKLAENYENDATDTSVVIKTNHYAEIYGRRSKTPIYMRLPSTRTFQLLYSVQFKVPIRAGDCGSWVFNEISGQLVGFVVAGSPRTGWCLVSPARVALGKMIALLEGLPHPGKTEAPTQLPASALPPPPTIGTDLFGPQDLFASADFFGFRDPFASGDPPKFLPVETNGQLSYGTPKTANLNTPIQINIQAVLDRGFFRSEGESTCYRRYYFSCVCSYDLTPTDYNLPMTYVPQGESTAYQVFGFTISISSVVSDNEARSIDLVLHTPKRDKGPTSSPGKIRLSPKPPQRPQIRSKGLSQMYSEGHSQSQSPHVPYATEHRFDRVQFTRATANNGRRQAKQEYFHLVVELYADIGLQKPGQQYIKIASRKSEKLVVRGRSPSLQQRGSASQRPEDSGDDSKTISQYDLESTKATYNSPSTPQTELSREPDKQRRRHSVSTN